MVPAKKNNRNNRVMDDNGTEKAVMLSIRRKWVDLILDGKKTVEVRKSRPRKDPPFTVYIYQTNGKNAADRNVHDATVVGEFECDRIDHFTGGSEFLKVAYEDGCLTEEDVGRYWSGDIDAYLWHISNLKAYEQPKELGEFYKEKRPDWDAIPSIKVKRGPQSWMIVEKQS